MKATSPILSVLRAALAHGLLLILITASSAHADGTFRRIALTGDQAPGAPEGAVFDELGGFPGVGDDFPPRIDADGNAAFHAVISGTGVNGVNLADGNGLGLWKQVDGVATLVARQDDPAPGTAPGVEFSSFSTNFVPEPPSIASGFAVYAALLRGPGIDTQFGTNANGIWRETADGTELRVRTDDAAPGLPAGHTVRVIGIPFVASTRLFLFNGVYRMPGESPGSVNANQEAFWTDRSGMLETLAFGGQQAPGVEPGVVFGAGTQTAIEGTFRSWGTNDALKLAFNGNLRGPGIDDFNDEGIWVEEDGMLTLLVREGDPSPEIAPGVQFGMSSGIDTFGDLIPVMMNDSGAILFGARHRGGEIPFTRAIWTTRSGSLELVVYGTLPVSGSAPGSPAPGMGPGATFSTIPFAQLNDANDIAISGFATIDMDFDNQPQGVWWDRPEELTLVVREDDPVPGLPGIAFAGFNRTLSFGAGGHLAFLADLRDSANGDPLGTALVMTDPQGGLQLLARTSGLFDVFGDGSDVRIVGSILPGVVSPSGEIPLELRFVDGSSGLFVAALAAPVGVSAIRDSAARIALTSPQPNPRIGAVPLTLRFALDRPGSARFLLYDVSGRRIAARGSEYFPAGPQAVRWNPGQMASGVYFMRLESESGASAVVRCVMLK
jgi:hypothetical protein